MLEHVKAYGSFSSYRLNKESSLITRLPVTDQIRLPVQSHLLSIHLPSINLPVNPLPPANYLVTDPLLGILPKNSLDTARNASGSKNHGKEIANLIKLYTDEAKYSGEKDNFDYKLTIFLDLCRKANILQDGLS